MILDYFVQFTGGSAAPGNNNQATDSPTTGTQTSSNQIDLHMAGIPVLANLQGVQGSLKASGDVDMQKPRC